MKKLCLVLFTFFLNFAVLATDFSVFSEAEILKIIDQHINHINIQNTPEEDVKELTFGLERLQLAFLQRNDRHRFLKVTQLLDDFIVKYKDDPNKLALGKVTKTIVCSRKAIQTRAFRHKPWHDKLAECKTKSTTATFSLAAFLSRPEKAFLHWPRKEQRLLYEQLLAFNDIRPPHWDIASHYLMHNYKTKYDAGWLLARLNAIEATDDLTKYILYVRKALLFATSDPIETQKGWPGEGNAEFFTKKAIEVGNNLPNKKFADLLIILPRGDLIPKALRSYHKEKTKRYILNCKDICKKNLPSYLGGYISVFRDMSILDNFPVQEYQFESDMMNALELTRMDFDITQALKLTERFQAVQKYVHNDNRRLNYASTLTHSCQYLPLSHSCHQQIQDYLPESLSIMKVIYLQSLLNSGHLEELKRLVHELQTPKNKLILYALLLMK